MVESLPELQLADHLISQRRNTYQQFPHHYMRENGGSGENNYHTVNRYGYNYNRPRLWQIIQEESERRYVHSPPPLVELHSANSRRHGTDRSTQGTRTGQGGAYWCAIQAVAGRGCAAITALQRKVRFSSPLPTRFSHLTHNVHAHTDHHRTARSAQPHRCSSRPCGTRV